MPTLRVELLKSREEDVIVENRVVHNSRVKLVTGQSQHASKSNKYESTELKPARRVSMGKVLGITKNLGANEVNGALLNSFKGHNPQSPSESDSFSIASSSSSCKSEADSIKKPSPPPSLASQPRTESLHINLGAYFGAMWDANHLPPCDLSKAIHEKFLERKSPQNGFLEFRFSKGRMVDTRPRKTNEGKAADHSDGKDQGGYAMKHDHSLHMETSGVATSTFSLASACSPKNCLKTSHCSGDTCNITVAGHEHKHTQSINELMAESRHSSHAEGELVSVEERRQCQVEVDDDNCKGHNVLCVSQATNIKLSVHPFVHDVSMHTKTADINSGCMENEKRLVYSRTLSCQASEGKHEEMFSFKAVACQDAHMEMIAPCGHAALVNESTHHPGVVCVQSKAASAKACVGKYALSTPLKVGKCTPTVRSHEGGNSTTYLHGLGADMHVHGLSGKFTMSEADATTPPPVHEIKCKANFDELTPLSPLSLSEASTLDMYDDECGRDYFNMAWLATSKTQSPLGHHVKGQWDWRSKSIGARASLRSAVRNLEAAFGGSRSVSLPKTRSQTDEKERKSERSKFIDRFVSPVKNRHRRSETLKQSAQRLSYSGAQVSEDVTRNDTPKRRDAYCSDNGWESAGSDYCSVRPGLPPPAPNKHIQKSNMSEVKVSSIMFLPASRSIHSLAPLKNLSGLTSPLISTPPSSALSPVTPPASCMLQGYLQCFERDGKTCYTLSLKDSDEMLLAKACTFAHNSSKEGCKCMYTFQSGRSKSRGKGTNGWRSWLKKDNKFTTDMAGKMQVSSELCSEMSPTGNNIQYLVSEFVLYDEKSDDGTRSQSLRFSSSSDGCHSTCTTMESPLSAQSASEFARPVMEARKQGTSIPRSPSSARMNSKWASINHQARSYSPLKKGTPAHHHPSYSIDIWSDSDIAEPEVPRERSHSAFQSELAAIVIKMPINDEEEDNHELSNSSCRRSLKFSDDHSKGPQRDRQNGCKMLDVAALPAVKQGGLLSHTTCAPTAGCVTLMLPKENHGLPKDGVHGPTSLINRWKCGGKCDCGGWDLGCGMKVFSNKRCEMLAAESGYGNSIQSIAHKQPLVLYSQGKTQRVLLSLCLVQEGYFILKFHSELSPLKAFAASVAILHGRESSTCRGRWVPIVKTSQQCHSEPETVGRSNDRPVFLEVCNDIPTWCPAGGRAPSPYGRA